MPIRKRFTKPKRIHYHRNYGPFSTPPFEKDPVRAGYNVRNVPPPKLWGDKAKGFELVRVSSEHFTGQLFSKLLKTLPGEPDVYCKYSKSVINSKYSRAVYIGLMHHRHYFHTPYLSIGMWVRDFPVLYGNGYAIIDGKIVAPDKHDILKGWTYLGEMEPLKPILRTTGAVEHNGRIVYRSDTEMKLEDRALDEIIEAFRQRYARWNGKYEFIF
jgi:hypothetical protein